MDGNSPERHHGEPRAIEITGRNYLFLEMVSSLYRKIHTLDTQSGVRLIEFFVVAI